MSEGRALPPLADAQSSSDPGPPLCVFAGEHEDAIGEVTSGCPSPSLGHNIAIGYVRAPHHKVGTEVQLLVRNKFLRAKVAKMPFVPSHYYMAPK